MPSSQSRPTEWTPDWVTHPGEHLAEYLDCRGWQTADLAREIDAPVQLIEQVLNGRAPVTPDLARRLEAVFDMKAYIWISLQSAWDRRNRSELIESRAAATRF